MNKQEKLNSSSENFYLTKTPVKKLLFKFAIPCVLAMLVSALYNIVDQIFLGNSSAGNFGIMATTLVFPFTVVALALAQFIGDGCAALFSIAQGSKDEKTTKSCVGNAIICVVFIGLILTAIGFILMNPIMKVLGADGYDETTKLYTRQYLTIILAGVPFYMFSSAAASIIRADGSPKYSMVSTVVGAVINLIFDPILIFACNMGVQGAAIATILGQFVSAIMCLIYFRKMKMIKLSKESFKPEFKIIGRFLKLGISSFITQIAIAIITIVANNVVGSIGGEHATEAGSALGIVFKVFAIVISFSLGIAVGAQPIIGYNYGAKQYKRVIDTYKLVVISNIVVGLIATILFEFAPNLIVKCFGQGTEFYRNYAVSSFRIYLGGILFCCLQKSSCTFLQSIEKPYKAMVLSLMRDVILLVPGVCLLGLLGDLNLMLWAGIIADVGAFIPTLIFAIIECGKMKKLTATSSEETTISTTLNSNNKFIITIDREFGSGGKFIGEELAKRLKIKCYDNELLTRVAENYNINIDELKNVDEKQKSSFWYGFATNTIFDQSKNEVLPISPEDNLFLKQARTIENFYGKESCIIIGRCADFILKDRSNVISIFIYSSSLQFKIDRKSKLENCSENETLSNIKKIDKQRNDYYNHFTSQKWGDKNNYELCLNTYKLGVEESVDIAYNYIIKRLNNLQIKIK